MCDLGKGGAELSNHEYRFKKPIMLERLDAVDILDDNGNFVDEKLLLYLKGYGDKKPFELLVSEIIYNAMTKGWLAEYLDEAC